MHCSAIKRQRIYCTPLSQPFLTNTIEHAKRSNLFALSLLLSYCVFAFHSFSKFFIPCYFCYFPSFYFILFYFLHLLPDKRKHLKKHETSTGFYKTLVSIYLAHLIQHRKITIDDRRNNKILNLYM
jgi:hypothetical protein